MKGFLSQVKGRVESGMGEVVKKRERLIPAWKVRGIAVESPTYYSSVGKTEYSLTWISQPQHYGQFGPDNSLLGGCPCHCRMLHSIPGLHLLDTTIAHPLPLSTPLPKYLQTLSNVS